MKDKIKDVIELQWVPAIATMIVISIIIISCFSWTIARIEQQSARTDRLYEMFINLLKEQK